MLQINTEKNFKIVNIDGFDYKVRKLGAGEALTMQKSSRELTKLESLETRTKEQDNRREDLTIELLEICFDIFQTDDAKAKKYIQTLDIEILLKVINQIFEAKDEPKT